MTRASKRPLPALLLRAGLDRPLRVAALSAAVASSIAGSSRSCRLMAAAAIALAARLGIMPALEGIMLTLVVGIIINGGDGRGSPLVA